MLNLTNRNIRMRYLEEKERAKERGENFTYADMAEMFESDDRTVYTWVSMVPGMQHLPSNEAKRARLLEWINDGVLARTKK